MLAWHAAAAMNRHSAPMVAALVVAFAMSGALALGHGSLLASALEHVELSTLDARFRVRGPRPTTGEVVLVALDDETLRQAPELIQKRAGFAALLDAVHAAGAKVVGVDAFFAEPESPIDAVLVDDVRAFIDDAAAFATASEPAASLLRRVREETRGDDVLAAAIARGSHDGRATVLGIHPKARGVALDDETVRRARYGQVAADSAGTVRSADAFLASLPRFSSSAAAVGLVTIELDDDQVGRRLAAARRHVGGAASGAVLAPLAVHVAARMRGLTATQVGYLPGSAILLGPTTRAPVFDDALLLSFRGPRATFPTYSAVDVVGGRIPPDALRGRAVLVGFTYLSHDVFATPFDAASPGLEVHATAVDNLLAGDALSRSSALVDAAFALLLGLAIAALYSRAGPGRAAVRLVGSAVVVVAGATIAHGAFVSSMNTWLALAAPAATAAAASIAALVTAYLTEGAERRRLRKAFAHYLADEVITELMANPQALALGGARRNVTILFSDIRDFTTLSEKMEPLALSRFLNDYLTPMTRAVLEQRGFIDKYVGDAVMAVFGAPAPTHDHPDRALATALDMHRRLLLLRTTVHPDLAIGVGINTGEAVAGNMGSAERFDYTVIGDAVNLASRLESLTKRYGVFCIVGDNTRKRATAAAFRFREIDLVRVKGRTQPVAIHELIVCDGYVDVEAFDSAVAAFREGRFAEARAGFTGFRDRNAGDAVVALYIDRLSQLGDAAPEGWDGVVDHLTK